MVLLEHDLRTAESVAADLMSAEDVQGFAERAVRGLLALIPTDSGHGFNEIRQEPYVASFAYIEPDAPDAPDAAEVMDRYWRQSPTSSPNVGAAGGVYRWSDLIERPELERLDLYQLAFRPAGDRFIAKIAFPTDPLSSDSFMLGRTSSDFSDDEISMLRMLAPTLCFAYRSLRARERAQLAETALVSHGVGVVFVTDRCRIADGLGAAQDLLSSWFPGTNGALPADLADWVTQQRRLRPLDRDTNAALSFRGARGTLTLRFVARHSDSGLDELHLEEIGPDVSIAHRYGLTPREVEVLTLVADGRTNREVAEALFLSLTTVRRHLENVFRKLDVHTRTAAASKAFPRGAPSTPPRAA